MTGLRQRFLSLGESDLTAEFQKICGIRIHRDISPVKEETNGIPCGSYVISSGSTGSSPRSAIVSGNGYDSSEETVSKNGLTEHWCNGVGHKNVRTENFLKERNHVHHKNGYSKHANGNVVSSNGFSQHGRSHVETTQNGNSGQQGPKTASSNGHLLTKATGDSPLKYTIENYLLYYIFSFGASLGNEIFYITFFTGSLWNFDTYVVRKVCIVWCVIMYIGQAAKDVIRWPRPKSPPVVHLEERYVLEYGMPSTHAMVGVAIPFGMIIFMSGRYEFNLLFGLLFAITWSILVSFSRLYLGMHSVLDILAGLLFAFVMMIATLPVVDPVDQFLMSHPNAIPVLVAVCVALCLLYPSLDKWSTARGDTTLVLAVFSGIYAGLWLTRALTDFEPEPDSPPFVLGLPSMNFVFMALLRQVIGVFSLVVLMSAMKVVMLRTVCFLFGFDAQNPASKRHLLIELPYKYVSYFVASAFATYVAPLLFLKLNIERHGYYSEIFNHSIL